MTSHRERQLLVEAVGELQAEIDALTEIAKATPSARFALGDPRAERVQELVGTISAELARATSDLAMVKRGGSLRRQTVLRARDRLRAHRGELVKHLEGQLRMNDRVSVRQLLDAQLALVRAYAPAIEATLKALEPWLPVFAALERLAARAEAIARISTIEVSGPDLRTKKKGEGEKRT